MGRSDPWSTLYPTVIKLSKGMLSKEEINEEVVLGKSLITEKSMQ